MAVHSSIMHLASTDKIVFPLKIYLYICGYLTFLRYVGAGSWGKISLHPFYCSRNIFLYGTLCGSLWRRQLQDNCCLTREPERPKAIRMLMCGLVLLFLRACINAILGSCILQEQQNDLDKWSFMIG